MLEERPIQVSNQLKVSNQEFTKKNTVTVTLIFTFCVLSLPTRTSPTLPAA